jgi:hypothetical protein
VYLQVQRLQFAVQALRATRSDTKHSLRTTFLQSH